MHVNSDPSRMAGHDDTVRYSHRLFGGVGFRAMAPSPSKYNTTNPTAQNAGYSHPPPLLVKS